jgi:hypothetical protein
MKRPYIFKAKLWCDCDEDEMYGAVIAENFKDAAGQIEDYFLMDLLSFEIFGLEDGPLTFERETFERLKEDNL